MKTSWKAGLGVVVSALLIWWVLRGVDAGDVWAAIREANVWLLLTAAAVGTSGFLIRALRWKVLLHPLRPDTGLRDRFAAVCIGFSANNLLPARVGEFARAWAIARLERIPATGALGSLVVERFLDLVAVFALMALAVLHPSFPAEATVAGASVGAFARALVLLIGILLGGLVVLVAFPGTAMRLVAVFARPFPERAGRLVAAGFGSFVDGLAALRDPRLLIPGLAWSLGLWLWNAFSFWIAIRAVGIDLGMAPTLFIQGIIVLGVAVPSAPGFFGTFHAAAVVGLVEVYGAPQAATLAFAFGYHLGMFFPVTITGLWFAGRLGMSMREISGSEARLQRDATAPASEPFAAQEVGSGPGVG